MTNKDEIKKLWKNWNPVIIIFGIIILLISSVVIYEKVEPEIIISNYHEGIARTGYEYLEGFNLWNNVTGSKLSGFQERCDLDNTTCIYKGLWWFKK